MICTHWGNFQGLFVWCNKMEGERESHRCFPDVQLLVMDFLFQESECVSSSSSTDGVQEPGPARKRRTHYPHYPRCPVCLWSEPLAEATVTCRGVHWQTAATKTRFDQGLLHEKAGPFVRTWLKLLQWLLSHYSELIDAVSLLTMGKTDSWKDPHLQ